MPKLKTNRGAAKRFKRMGNGKLKCRRAYRNHILTKKSQQRKRQLRAMSTVNESNKKQIERLLPE